jgi:hypothetical protein
MKNEHKDKEVIEIPSPIPLTRKALNLYYTKKGLSMIEVAEISGTSPGKVRKTLIKFGIKTRSRTAQVRLGAKRTEVYKAGWTSVVDAKMSKGNGPKPDDTITAYREDPTLLDSYKEAKEAKEPGSYQRWLDDLAIKEVQRLLREELCS